MATEERGEKKYFKIMPDVVKKERENVLHVDKQRNRIDFD
jgi:hypothetical protein